MLLVAQLQPDVMELFWDSRLNITSVVAAWRGVFFWIFFFNLLSVSIKILTTVVVKMVPRGLGSCWKGGGCRLSSVETHDLF